MRINKKLIKSGAIFACSLLVFVFALRFTGAALSKATLISAWGYLPEGTLMLSASSEEAHELSSEVSREESRAESSRETSSEGGTSGESEYSPPNFGLAEQTPTGGTIGKIVRKHYTATTSDSFIKLDSSAFLRNVTKISNDEVLAHTKDKPDLKIEKTLDENKPQVLIYHTHTTESFEYSEKDTFDSAYNVRARDKNKNMVAVGTAITNQLLAAGISVVHDDTEHDYPSYSGAYERSAATIQKYLDKYPSIKVMIDVHRDAITGDDGTRYAAIAEVGGKKAAQVMLISGADNGKLNMPNFYKNLAFSSLVQRTFESDCPGITRPILFDYRKYNQHMLPNSFLLEVGAQGNSIGEALYTGELFGKSLAKALLTTV